MDRPSGLLPGNPNNPGREPRKPTESPRPRSRCYGCRTNGLILCEQRPADRDQRGQTYSLERGMKAWHHVFKKFLT